MKKKGYKRKYTAAMFRRELPLHFMILPGLALVLLFSYVPMGGLRIAFMDYNQYNPAKSTWVGFDQFDFPMGCCLYGGFSP